MRSLVTGGLGFIRRNEANRLLREGHDVIPFDNARRMGVMKNLDWLRARHGERVHWMNGDVCNFGAVQKAMQGVGLVSHLAAHVAVTTSLDKPQQDSIINAQGTVNVLEAARKISPPPILLYTSTNKVYGGLETFNFSTGCVITVRDLAEKMREVTGFRGQILWDTIPRRPLDIHVLCGDASKANSVLGWKPTVSLDAGLRMTMEFWRKKLAS